MSRVAAISSKPTVTQDELNRIVGQGWIDAEKLKAKKEKAIQRPSSSMSIKKSQIKSQNTILEENALSKITAQAWTSVEVKKQKELKECKTSRKVHLKS